MKPLPQHPACTRLPQDLVKAVEEAGREKGAEIDRLNRVPKEVLEDLASKGFFAIAVPKEYGGLGLGLAGLTCIARIAAKYSIPLASIAIIHGGVALALARHGSRKAREELLPRMARGEEVAAVSITEPGGGSDLASTVKTMYVKNGDTLKVRGEKVFTSNGAYAALFLVLGRGPDDPKSFTLAIVPRSERVRVEPLNLTVFRGAGIARVIFDDAETSVEMVLGRPGEGLKIGLEAINIGRLAYAAMGLGAVEGLLEETVRYASKHILFGQTLLDFQGPRWSLARLYSKAYTLAHSLNAAIDAAGEAGSPDPLEASILKMVASELAVEAAQLATRLHGGRGFSEGSLTERMLRDTLALTIGEGANEVILEFVSKKALRE